jgi:hypothetical protein
MSAITAADMRELENMENIPADLQFDGYNPTRNDLIINKIKALIIKSIVELKNAEKMKGTDSEIETKIANKLKAMGNVKFFNKTEEDQFDLSDEILFDKQYNIRRMINQAPELILWRAKQNVKKRHNERRKDGGESKGGRKTRRKRKRKRKHTRRRRRKTRRRRKGGKKRKTRRRKIMVGCRKN